SSLGEIVTLQDFPDAANIPAPTTLKHSGNKEEIIVETYGRLKTNSPLFGKCDKDIIYEGDEKDSRRYVRWRWGSTNLNK
ncbi:6690_t:CDS:2, partial [Scutellospora calospora]